MFFSLGVLSSTTGRAVSEVDSAVLAVEFGHYESVYIRVFLLIYSMFWIGLS